jgi:hypothetical protein
MKKPLIAAGIAILATISFTAYGAYYKKQQPTFEIYGEDVLATTAPDGIVAHARHEVHELFVDWKTDAEGKQHDPSFLESSRSWMTGQPKEAQTLALDRGTTEFNDAQGHHIVIEVIEGKNMPTLVFFSPQSGNGTMPVLNAFVASLQKQGVKPAGH